MAGISDGQPVDAANSNGAWIAKNGDDATIGKLALQNTDVVSGAFITNTQRAINSLFTTTGATETTPATTYSAQTNTIDDGDDHELALSKLAAKFHSTTGHVHTGADGDAPPVSAGDLANSPLRGYVTRGTDLTGVSGDDTDVSTEMTGKTASTGVTSTGVVVTTSYNRVELRQASGVEAGDSFVDDDGNIVYGRITESAGTWTLSYFVDLSGTETPYSFPSPVDVRWWYQELYNTLDGTAPVYSEIFQTPSDNTTADVIHATSTLYGIVILATAAGADVASAGAAGTANGTVANANHTHRGAFTVKKSGDTDIFGTITLSQGTAISIAQVGNDLSFSVDLATTGIRGAVLLATAAAADVGSAGTAGTANGTVANADHVHRGAFTVKKTGSPDIFGTITLSQDTGITLTQVGNDIAISVNLATTTIRGGVLLATAAPVSVSSTNSAGTANGTVANADHQHQGVHSISASGEPLLYNDVTLSAGTGITLTQVGQDIEIEATGGGGGGGALVVTGSRGTPQNITAGGGIGFTGTDARQLWFIQGSGGHVDVTANPQIAAGSTVGQELYLIGRNNDQTVKLEDGTGLSLNGEWYAEEDSSLLLLWDGTNWTELSRSN